MGKQSPSSPPPRDLAKEISQILSTGPSLVGSEYLLSPQQTGLDLSNLNLALYGTPAGTRQVTTQTPESGWVNQRTGQFVTELPSVVREGGGPQRERREEWMPFTRMTSQTQDVATPAQSGLLELYRQLGPETQALNTASRTATAADLRAINPGQAGLYDLLTQSAQQGLKAGSRMSPEDTWRITTGVRSNWADRGVGNAPAAQLDEALQLFGGGQQLLQQRQQTAGNVAQLGSQLYTMPALTFADNANPGSLMEWGSQYGQQPNILQSLGGYGADLFNTNFNADAANRINRANANNAATSNAASIAGTMAAAAIAL